MTSSEIKIKKNQYTNLLNALNSAITPLNRSIDSATTVSNNLISHYSVNDEKPDGGISSNSVTNLNSVKAKLNNVIESVQTKILRLEAEYRAAKKAEELAD